MFQTPKITKRILFSAIVLVLLTSASRYLKADTGTCGGFTTTLPFTDVPAGNIFFCAVAEAFFSGLTNGTTPTTYKPGDPVPREQMAAFITRTQDSALKRGSRRAALNQWFMPASIGAMRSIDMGANGFPRAIACDGQDLWVALGNGTVKRVQASDGKVLQTWTGAISPNGILVAAGRIFVTGYNGGSPGKIYVISPEATPGPMTIFENDVGLGPGPITFDGTNLWTANQFGGITRVDVTTTVDSTFTAGLNSILNILWDGSNLWALDYTDSHLKRIDLSNGTVLESIAVVPSPLGMAFDGTNIWVGGGVVDNPNTISIVRAVGGLRGTVLATLAVGSQARSLAFDGERMFVCDHDGNSVMVFKAADFSLLSTVSTGANTSPSLACSDGIHFWFAKLSETTITRF